MKYIRRISLVSLISLLSAGSGNNLPTSISTREIYGPFLNTTNVMMEFHNSNALRYSGAIEYYSELTGNMYGNETFAISSKGYSEYEFMCKNYLSAGVGYGIQVKFRVESKTSTSSYITSTIRQPGKDQFVAKDKKSFPYVCWGIQKGVIINEESYDFEDMNEYFTSDSNNALDVSEISFTYYPEDTTFKHANAYLLITDYENLFPKLTNFTGSNTFWVPLSVIQNGNRISFDVNTNMYVNYSTLEMSYFSLAGFTATNEFYIPISENDNFQNNEMKIIIEKAGFNESKIQINVSYFNNRDFFGNCSNSEYCIEGGIRA